MSKAESMGVQEVEKALDFFQRYDESDLRRLGAIRIPSRGSRASERHLSVEHLRRLSAVSDPAMKGVLLSGLEAGLWSVERLTLEIKSLWGKSGGTGGRAVAKPASLVDGLAQVEQQCRAWLRFHDAAWTDGAPWLTESVAATSGVADLAGRIQDAMALLKRLRRAADLLEDRLEGVARDQKRAVDRSG